MSLERTADAAARATRAGSPPPAVPDGFPDRCALFLDLDGTVLDLASTPGGVSIPAETVAAIGVLAQRLGGALAIVTGRPLADVDSILAPLRLPCAALHGAELRRRGGGRVADSGYAPPSRLTAALGAFVDARPGLSLEDKGASVAVHYRATPERGEEVRRRMAELVDQLAPTHELQPGKMVVEVRPRGCDKGAALSALMAEPPFAGRTPVMLGDDLTDEFGFKAAVAAGGGAILVGAVERPTAAAWSLPDPAAVRAWLLALSASA
jgi:trehalose 6-phosphate phosphatase